MNNKKLLDMLYASMFAALIVVLAYVAVPLPFTPVIITGQTLAIMLIGLMLTPSQAFMSVGIYLLLGAIGLPVFSAGASGLGFLIGPKGGYYFGFLIGAVVMSILRGKENKIPRMAISCFIGGILIVYVIGVTWLKFSTGMGFIQAITAGALPFIPGDLIKVSIATVVAQKMNQHIKVRKLA